MGQLRPNEQVLIQSGAGGVGTAAIQLARSVEARIFATTGSSHKIPFLKNLQVDHAIDRRHQDLAQIVLESTVGNGLDLILDGIGGSALKKAYQLLAPLGRLVSYGLSSAAPAPRPSRLKTLLALWRTPWFRPLDLIGRNVGVFGFHLALLGSRQEEVSSALDHLLRMVQTRTIRPVVDCSFPLDARGAALAHQYIHDRKNLGKVVLVTKQE